MLMSVMRCLSCVDAYVCNILFELYGCLCVMCCLSRIDAYVCDVLFELC